jgi:hypothetical protein
MRRAKKRTFVQPLNAAADEMFLRNGTQRAIVGLQRLMERRRDGGLWIKDL